MSSPASPVRACVWPRPLLPGGTIGLCSPASPSSPEMLSRAATALESRGYRVIVSPHAGAVHPHPRRTYLAGTEVERAADLNALFRDHTVDLILCARGGYGSGKLLDCLDYDAIRADLTPLVGYSDITALSLGIAARAGVVTFSGIMATAGHGFGEDSLDPWSEHSFFRAVGPSPFPRVLYSPEESVPWRVLRGPAIVSGPVIPVCLSLLNALLGTPYVPDMTGAILVIEDINESLYRMDRCLTQLRLAGILDGLAAILVGSFSGGTPEEDEQRRQDIALLALEFAPESVAVASGVAYGHIPRRLTLPVGAIATVDLEAGTFTFDKDIAG